MKDRFSKTELCTSILVNYGDGKKRAIFVDRIIELQKSSEDGQLEFEGKNGMYVFCKNGSSVTFKKGNGAFVRRKLDGGGH